MELDDRPIDALTGLATFRGLHAALNEPAAAIFLDIDGFIRVNDRFGHLAGDDVLKALGAWLTKEAGSLHGLVFRVAGDEFIILLPGRTLDDAFGVAERFVATCPRLQWPSSEARITLSAVVFLADADLPGNRRAILDSFAEKLYQGELASGRAQSNVVTA